MKTQDPGPRPPSNLLVAAAASFCLLVAPTAQGFARNRLEFGLDVTTLLLYLAGASALLFGLLWLLLRFAGRLREPLVLGLAGLCALALLESQFLGSAYAPLAGTLAHKTVLGSRLGNSLVWLLAVAGLVLARKGLAQQVRPILGGLAGLQAAYLLVALFTGRAALADEKAATKALQRGALSERGNVLVLILDTVQSDRFSALMDEGAIDKGAFDGFTFFRNATSGFSITHASIPNLLAGTFYRNERPFRAYAEDVARDPAFVVNVAREAGYEPRIHTTPRVLPGIETARFSPGTPLASFAKAVEFAVFRQSPRLLKELVYNDGNWRASRALGLQETFGLVDNLELYASLPTWSALDVAPQLRVYHLLGAHEPYHHDESLARVDKPPSYEQVLVGLGKLLESLFARLQSLGIYDQTAIFILADHSVGAPVRLSPQLEELFPGAAPLKNKSRGLPLVMVKPFRARGPLAVDDAPVELADVPATIASMLGVPGHGRSMFEIPPEEPRRRLHYELADLAWDVETDKLSPMKEWAVEGYAWLDRSWTSTGENLGDATELLQAFVSHQQGAALLRSPRLVTNGDPPRIQLTSTHALWVKFPGAEVKPGDRVGLAARLEGLDPSRRYRVRFVVEDAYGSENPGRLFQEVFLGEHLVDEYDIGDPSGAKVRNVDLTLGPGVEQEQVRVELHSKTEEPWGWGNVALRLQNVTIEALP